MISITNTTRYGKELEANTTPPQPKKAQKSVNISGKQKTLFSWVKTRISFNQPSFFVTRSSKLKTFHKKPVSFYFPVEQYSEQGYHGEINE